MERKKNNNTKAYLKGPTRKLGRYFLPGQVATGEREMTLNWKRADLD